MDRPSSSNVVPDFQRRVYCVMGLPFDALAMDGAVAKVQHAVRTRTRCLLVTPNLNFIAESARDPAFRDTLLEADLSLADGMPLIWAARCLRIPLYKRVSGADLFDTLAEAAIAPKLSVFLFGGSHGVAARAGERIQASSTGLRCAGALEPPFGTAEELSQRAIVDTINASGADFLVLALGARKGHEWIARNQWSLAPLVISHLGAVIKYTAGEVARAPQWIQDFGLEWLWRVKEEPELWRRYLGDALVVMRLMLGRTLPLALRNLGAKMLPTRSDAAEVTLSSAGSVNSLRLAGAWSEENSAPLRLAMARAVALPGDLRVDLSATSGLDSAVIALLLLLRGHCLRCGIGLDLVNVCDDARRALHLHGADYLLEPVSTRTAPAAPSSDATWLAPQFSSRIERAD